MGPWFWICEQLEEILNMKRLEIHSRIASFASQSALIYSAIHIHAAEYFAAALWAVALGVFWAYHEWANDQLDALTEESEA